MARIPTYGGVRVNAPQVPGGLAGMEAAGYDALGRGLQDLGASLVNRDRRIEAEAEAAKLKLDQDEAKVYVARTLAGLRTRMVVEENELKNTIGPGAGGYTPEYLKRFDGFSEEILQGAPNDIAKQVLTERLAELKGAYADSALNFEAAAGQVQREKDLLDGVRMSANYLRTHPSEFESILDEQRTSLSAIADKLPADEEEKLTWTMENSLATSSIEGEISVAPGTARKRLAAGHWDKYITPDQKNAFLKAAEAKLKENNAVAQYQMSKMIENHLASIEDTGVGIPGVSAGRVAAVFSEVAGMKFADQERLAGKVHSAKIEIGARQSPAERMELLGRYAPDRVNRPGTYAEDREVYSRLVSAVQQDAELLMKDPAAWANKDNGIAQLAATTSTLTAAETSLARQRRGGLADHETRVLPKDHAARLVGAMESSSTKEKLQTIASLESEYGSHFPKVMSELIESGLSPNYMVVYNVQKTSPKVAALLAESTGIKKEDVASQFKASGRGAWSTVESAVEANFNPLAQAATYVYPGRRSEFSHITDLYSITAGNLVLSGRFKNAADASRFLYQQSFGKMHVDRTFYLPETTESGTPINTDKAATDLRRLLREPKWIASKQMETSISLPVGGISKSARQSVDQKMLASGGIWVNSADGKSLELFVETKTGFRRVYEVAGAKRSQVRRPVTVSLEDLAKGQLKGDYQYTGESYEVPSAIELLGGQSLIVQ